MSIGYACKTVGVPKTYYKSCIIKNATPEKLRELISHNLHSLENCIEYNHSNRIHLFRISSDIIPFGSNPINTLSWEDLYYKELLHIGKKIKAYKLRVSMHPGQYTVINSPDKDVLKRSIKDLAYHTKLLKYLGTGTENKIILHIGGIYGDKKKSISNFIHHYRNLDSSIKMRLVIENDDKAYTIHDVLEIGKKLGIPVVFDNLHHLVNHYQDTLPDYDWINECETTWEQEDGKQKIHYSQQDPRKKPGSHSETIRIHEFLDYYQTVKQKNLDIMLEVKDKNLSAVKCILCTDTKSSITDLEREWSKYKYLVLETSPLIYNQIRSLLQNKRSFQVVSFYTLIENALLLSKNKGNSVNAAQHIWGYFKDVANETEKLSFQTIIRLFQHDQSKLPAMKRLLWKLAVKNQQKYLLDSYYFLLDTDYSKEKTSKILI